MSTRCAPSIALVLFALLALPLAGGAAERPTLPEFGEEIYVLADEPFVVPIESGLPVRIRFGVGEIDISASPADEVRADLEVRCRRTLSEALCEKYRRRLRLEPRERGDRIEVRWVGLSRWKLRKLRLEGTVYVPVSSPLEVRIGVGDIDIHTAGQDLAVQMGIGDLSVFAPERSVGEVEIATRIGDASLSDGRSTREGGRRLLLGSRLRWSDGSGDGRVTVALKIGDAKVTLE
ncbi:MAG: hypothetical protein R3244_10605 [Thermoanaerobaculia bacterium]|nr:hypothetical protein [Thermoanaerobaculia bacterium]